MTKLKVLLMATAAVFACLACEPAASRSASPAIPTPTQNNAQKMVQDSGEKTMDKRMEGGQERPHDIQTHADAYQEGAAAPREA